MYLCNRAVSSTLLFRANLIRLLVVVDSIGLPIVGALDLAILFDDVCYLGLLKWLFSARCDVFKLFVKR